MGVEISGDTSGLGGFDFWRSPAANGLVPNNVNDVSETVARTGKVGIGLALANPPIAQLDVANGGRSGAALTPNAGSAAYLTAAASPLGMLTPDVDPAIAIAEFRHSNGTQGIAITYNGLYATGNAANQDFILQNKGNGQFGIQHQDLNGGFAYVNYSIGAPALAANQGWQNRYFSNNSAITEHIHFIRRSALVTPGGTNAIEHLWQTRADSGGIVNAMSLRPSITQANTFSLHIDQDQVNDAKLVLFGFQQNPNFYGFGIRGSTLAYFIGSNAAHHRWYANTAVAGAAIQIMGLSGAGNLTIDPLGVATSGQSGPVVRFGSEASQTMIASNRVTVNRFQNGLEFSVANVTRFAVLGNGRLYAQNVPTFAGNAAALAGGLLTGEIYKDATGGLRIVL